MSTKPVIFILGKLPPPYFGPAITTEAILNSDLNNDFTLIHIDTQANESIDKLGRWSFKKVMKNITVYYQLFKKINTYKPSILLIPISQTNIGFIKDAIFIWIAILTRKKVVINFLGGEFDTFVAKAPKLLKSFIKKTLLNCNGVIVLGNKLKYLFSTYFEDENIYVIPNGADYSIVKTKNNSSKLKLVYIANLRKRKGIIETLEGVSMLDKDNYELSVVGSWQQNEIKEKCIDLINKNDLPVTIHSNISHDQKLELLGSSDIFIFPPNEPEGHPWVLVEALAAGLPIISTDQGAITESVINNVNGFIVPSNSPEKIAEKLSLLISDDKLRDSMSLKSKEIYHQKFTKNHMIDGFKKCFNETVYANNINKN